MPRAKAKVKRTHALFAIKCSVCKREAGAIQVPFATRRVYKDFFKGSIPYYCNECFFTLQEQIIANGVPYYVEKPDGSWELRVRHTRVKLKEDEDFNKLWNSRAPRK